MKKSKTCPELYRRIKMLVPSNDWEQMKNLKINSFWRFTLSFLILIFACLAGRQAFSISQVSAWVEPPSDGSNIAAPINTSSSAQTKQGDLTVQGLTSTQKVYVDNGQVNLGTSITVDKGLSGFGINFEKNSAHRAYGLFRDSGSWIQPLVWGAHTGSKIVSHGGYGGTSIYEDYNWSQGNWWHWGGPGTEIARFRHDNYGGSYFSSVLSAPIYYDYNNSGYYVNPDWWSNLAQVNITGNLCFNGDCRTNWNTTNETLQTVTTRGNTTDQTIYVPIIYDQNNAGYYVNPDSWSNFNALAVNDLRFSYMYDRDNTGYYVDPNNWSNFLGVNVTDLRFSYAYDNNNTGYYLDLNNWSNFNAVNANYYHTSLNDSWFPYPGNNYNYIRGNSFINGVIYDENNSGYYVDPNGTSNLNQVCLNGDCRTSWPRYFSIYAAYGGAYCPSGYHIILAALSFASYSSYCIISGNGILTSSEGYGLCERD